MLADAASHMAPAVSVTRLHPAEASSPGIAPSKVKKSASEFKPKQAKSPVVTAEEASHLPQSDRPRKRAKKVSNCEEATHMTSQPTAVTQQNFEQNNSEGPGTGAQPPSEALPKEIAKVSSQGVAAMSPRKVMIPS